MAPFEIIKRYRIIAGGSQRFACVTANEPCAARDKDVFHRRSDSRLWRALHLPEFQKAYVAHLTYLLAETEHDLPQFRAALSRRNGLAAWAWFIRKRAKA